MNQKKISSLSEKEVNANYLKFREIADSRRGQQGQQFEPNQVIPSQNSLSQGQNAGS